LLHDRVSYAKHATTGVLHVPTACVEGAKSRSTRFFVPSR